MKKLLSIIAVSAFALGIMIIGRPVDNGQYKGEDFFMIDYGTESNIFDGFWYKDGNLKGFGTITKDKAEKLLKDFQSKRETSA